MLSGHLGSSRQGWCTCLSWIPRPVLRTLRTPQLTLIEQVLSLSELCAHLQVSAQTIYDLRSQGRGPRSSRVGRKLRFRISEVEAWLARMEQDDDQRHFARGL